MLVLTRKERQEICIDGGIKITILETHGGSVRIGIDAPRSVGIVRGEVVESPKSNEPICRAG